LKVRLAGRGVVETEQRSSFGSAAEEMDAVFFDAFDDFVAGFADDDFFAVGEAEQGIGSGLGPLDEVEVDIKRVAVEASQLNHGWVLVSALEDVSAGREKR